MTRIRLRYCVLIALFVTVFSVSGEQAWRLVFPNALMTDRNRAKAEAGSAVVEVLPARDGDLAVLGLVRVGIDGQRLVAWVRQVEELQRSTYIPLAGHFSESPTLDDVGELTLDEEDLHDLRECRPGHCGLKLSAVEMSDVRRVITAAGADWKDAAQVAFRRVIVNRARAYLAAGHAGEAPYYDHETPVSAADEFAALSRAMELDVDAPTAMTHYLRSYPRANVPRVESFLYWSKEVLGGSKPIIAITHVSVFSATEASGRGAPITKDAAVAVAFKQVYATHYLTASLSLMWLTPAVDGASRYLVYARRSRADVLGGRFGGLIRRIIEGRIRSEAPAALDGMRRRLETEPARRTSDMS